MVGWALNGCASVRPMVPAHRVVNRTGMLSGFMHFEEPRLMQQLLKKEGVKVKNNTVQHFERLFWDPNKELEI
jgi:methylated-DNA-protein-cysteine methyltransferase-like protein